MDKTQGMVGMPRSEISPQVARAGNQACDLNSFRSAIQNQGMGILNGSSRCIIQFMSLDREFSLKGSIDLLVDGPSRHAMNSVHCEPGKIKGSESQSKLLECRLIHFLKPKAESPSLAQIYKAPSSPKFSALNFSPPYPRIVHPVAQRFP